MLFKVKKSGEKMPVCSPYCMGSFGSEGIQLFSVSLALSLSLSCLLAGCRGCGQALGPRAYQPTLKPCADRSLGGPLSQPRRFSNNSA